MADKRAKTSAENGRKGGRKKKPSTLASEKFRDLLAEAVMKDVKDFVVALFPKAKEGDVQAWNAIMDRAFGKPTQEMDLSSLGEKIQGVIVLPAPNKDN